MFCVVRDITVVLVIGVDGVVEVVWMVVMGLRVIKEQKVTQEAKGLEKNIDPKKTHYLS